MSIGSKSKFSISMFGKFSSLMFVPSNCKACSISWVFTFASSCVLASSGVISSSSSTVTNGGMVRASTTTPCDDGCIVVWTTGALTGTLVESLKLRIVGVLLGGCCFCLFINFSNSSKLSTIFIRLLNISSSRVAIPSSLTVLMTYLSIAFWDSLSDLRSSIVRLFLKFSKFVLRLKLL